MIIRRRHTANYTTIGNVLFEDERLAADEVGVLAYLLSRPHDWEVRRPALMRRWNMGRDAIKRVITNLVRFGWCRPEKTRLPNGTYFMIYEIRDEPGPELTAEEVRRALSLVSSEAASDETVADQGSPVVPDQVPVSGDPPTGHPSLAGPSPGDPHLAYKDIQTNDLPRTESTQKLEREHVRAREQHALDLAEFKRRWPTNAADDQGRVDRAWFALSFEDGAAALAGIAPFLAHQKQLGRKHAPAGFTYLEQKRWTLIEAAPAAPSAQAVYAADSAEAKALRVLHDMVGRRTAFWNIWRRADGTVTFPKPMTAQLTAVGQAEAAEKWATLTRNQAGAWEKLLDHVFDRGLVRERLREGSKAPWGWPPSVEGKVYTDTGPPAEGLMTDEDFDNFR